MSAIAASRKTERSPEIPRHVFVLDDFGNVYPAGEGGRPKRL
jgi:hypothetical protein